MRLDFDIEYTTKFSDSFRVQSLVGQYDLNKNDYVQKFKGSYKLPEKWNIGLIVGNSGTGKTSIAKKCFKKFTECEWSNSSIIENFDKNLSLSEITQCLGSVGFNCVPYWLKKYNVLSNGEKSRVEMARMALENDLVVYDEFTSLVDRDVAKSMSNSVQKMFRKMNKKLVAVTCHHDVIQWLQPDWVYNTDTETFSLGKLSERRNSHFKFTKQQDKHGSFIKSIII